MAWRELTEADIRPTLNSYERTSYEGLATSSGEAPIEETILAVVQQVRGYIADNPANTLAAGDTLPERCVRPAAHLVRNDLLTRLDIVISDDRRTDYKEAIRFLERVADGKVAIEKPEGAVEASASGSAIETVRPKERLNTRENLRGL